MIYRVVDDQNLMGEARELAERLAAGPTQAYGLMKRAFAASAANGLDAQLDLERDLQREAGAKDEYVEGVRAFLEKRAANFRKAPRGLRSVAGRHLPKRKARRFRRARGQLAPTEANGAEVCLVRVRPSTASGPGRFVGSGTSAPICRNRRRKQR